MVPQDFSEDLVQKESLSKCSSIIFYLRGIVILE